MIEGNRVFPVNLKISLSNALCQGLSTNCGGFSGSNSKCGGISRSHAVNARSRIRHGGLAGSLGCLIGDSGSRLLTGLAGGHGNFAAVKGELITLNNAVLLHVLDNVLPLFTTSGHISGLDHIAVAVDSEHIASLGGDGITRRILEAAGVEGVLSLLGLHLAADIHLHGAIDLIGGTGRCILLGEGQAIGLSGIFGINIEGLTVDFHAVQGVDLLAVNGDLIAVGTQEGVDQIGSLHITVVLSGLQGDFGIAHLQSHGVALAAVELEVVEVHAEAGAGGTVGLVVEDSVGAQHLTNISQLAAFKGQGLALGGVNGDGFSHCVLSLDVGIQGAVLMPLKLAESAIRLISVLRALISLFRFSRSTSS